MKDKIKEEVLILKTLIEIYDRELKIQSLLHKKFFYCKKCKSLIKQRKKMIYRLLELKKSLRGGE